MMETQLRDVSDRGEPIAALWASEETIYGRFGYGLASLCLNVKTEQRAGGLRFGLPPKKGRTRLVSHEEALDAFPLLYDRLRGRSVGFLSRSRAWWEEKIFDDRPERRRGGPMQRVLLELDGRPAGYALYRVASEGTGDDRRKTLRVLEAFGGDELATREIWRYLLSVDWIDAVEAYMLPLDHPLQLLVEPGSTSSARESGTGSGYGSSTSAPHCRQGGTRPTVGSPLTSSPTHSSRTTSVRGPWRTVSPGAAAVARTCASTYRRWAPPTSAASPSRSWLAPARWRKRHGAASPVPTRSSAPMPLRGVPRTSDALQGATESRRVPARAARGAPPDRPARTASAGRGSRHLLR